MSESKRSLSRKIGHTKKTNSAQVQRDTRGFIVCGTDAMAQGSWPLERPPMPYETTMPGSEQENDGVTG